MNASNDYQRQLRDVVTESRLARNLIQIHKKRDMRRLRRASLMTSACLFCGLLIIFGIYRLNQSPKPGPLKPLIVKPMQRIRIPVNAKAPEKVDLDDGSRLTVAPGAVLQVIENTGTEFTTWLEQGWVRFSVKPGGSRRWIVETGLASIEVRGTQFTVHRSPQVVLVTVHEGRVTLRGEYVPGRIQHLLARQSIEVRQSDSTMAEKEDNKISELPEGVEAEASRSSENIKSVEPFEVDNKRPAGSAITTTKATEPVQRLLNQVDLARSVGQPERAAELLRRILQDYPQDPGSCLAALTLGRLELDVLNDPVRAARSLEKATTLGLPESLREQAYALSVKALHRAGDRERAAQAAKAYRLRYPRGKWIDWVDNWVRQD